MRRHNDELQNGTLVALQWCILLNIVNLVWMAQTTVGAQTWHEATLQIMT
ncbi:hypothetical protein P8H26_10515 [Pseudochrobactrum sp. sp1633]|nr:hypothetical protein [Pseudochrobactrum sp. sp1633]MDM8345826.1 hypothetical protein [Pseudochrobactrum sp. sp1633]